MTGKIENSIGLVNISNDTLINLAGIAATECYGVVGMASKRATDGIVELLGKENMGKGVRINTNDDKVIFDLFVILEYGVSINTVANNIISKVKYNIETATGLHVDYINVHVVSVRI